MNPRDLSALEDMSALCRKAAIFVEGRSRQDLLRDELLQFGLTRVVELVGEAASRVSAELHAQTPRIQWRLIIATRNRLIHGYDSIDLEILWNTIKLDLPALASQIAVLLRTREVDDLSQ